MSDSCTLIWHSETKHVLGMQLQSSSNAMNVIPPEELLISGWERQDDKRLDFYLPFKSHDGTEQLKSTVIQDQSPLLRRWGYYRIVDGQVDRIEDEIVDVKLTSDKLTIIFASGGTGTKADTQSKTWCQVESDGSATINRIGSPTAPADNLAIDMPSLPQKPYRVLILALGRRPYFKSFPTFST